MRAHNPGSEGSVRPDAGIVAAGVRGTWNHARSVPEMRKASISRVSKETQIQVSLTIEGRGRHQISTGIRFFDHMLELFAHHGAFDLKLKATGDLDVDQHHTVEDVGIVLGQAFEKALSTKKGILRAGYFVMPMDETMGLAAVDFSGRRACCDDCNRGLRRGKPGIGQESV